MLMVGPHEVLQLGPWEPPFHIVFDRDTAPSELRAVRGALFSEDRDYEGRIGAAGFYKTNPGTEACRIPIRFVGSTYRMLQQSHTAVIERAALMARNPMTRRTHSPALVRFIAQETGERLFQPSYVEV